MFDLIDVEAAESWAEYHNIQQHEHHHKSEIICFRFQYRELVIYAKKKYWVYFC